MDREDNPSDLRPIPREDVLFTLRFALMRAVRSRSARRELTELDFQIMAAAVLEHLELCRIRFYRPPPGHQHFNPWKDHPPKE